MPFNTTPIFTKAPSIGVQRFVFADGITAKLIFTAGPDGARITGLHATSTDSAANRLYLYLRRSSVDYLVSSCAVPARAAGPPVVPGVAIMFNSTDTSWIDQDTSGNRYLDVQAGDTLYIAPAAVVTNTAGMQIDIIIRSASLSF